MVGYFRRSHIPPVVRAEAAPVPPNPGRLRSLLSLGKFASSISDAALFYGLAIGTLRHHLLPMVRVDALRPAR